MGANNYRDSNGYASAMALRDSEQSSERAVRGGKG